MVRNSGLHGYVIERYLPPHWSFGHRAVESNGVCQMHVVCAYISVAWIKLSPFSFLLLKNRKKSGCLIYALHLSTRAKKRNKTYILVVTRYITLLLLLRLSFEKSRSTAMKALSQYRNLYSLTTTDSSAPSTQAKANGCLGGGWGWWWLSQRFLTVPRRRTCCFNIGFFLTFLPSLLTPYNTSAVWGPTACIRSFS